LLLGGLFPQFLVFSLHVLILLFVVLRLLELSLVDVEDVVSAPGVRLQKLFVHQFSLRLPLRNGVVDLPVHLVAVFQVAEPRALSFSQDFVTLLQLPRLGSRVGILSLENLDENVVTPGFSVGLLVLAKGVLEPALRKSGDDPLHTLVKVGVEVNLAFYARLVVLDHREVVVELPLALRHQALYAHGGA